MNHTPTHLKATHQSDGSAILDVVQGTITTLNTTGGFIWQSLQDGMTEEDVIARLTHDFPDERTRITEDVHAFVVALGEHRLLSGQER